QGIPADQSFLDQWRVTLLYSLPAMMMSRVAMQRWGWGTTILQDAAMEPIQAVASVALSCGMGGVGWLPETNMTLGQLFRRELTEGFFYMGVGRGMGGAVDRFSARQSLPQLNDPFERAWATAPGEVGAVGERKRGSRRSDGLTPDQAKEKAAFDLMEFLRKNSSTRQDPAGLELGRKLHAWIDETVPADYDKFRRHLRKTLITNGGLDLRLTVFEKIPFLSDKPLKVGRMIDGVVPDPRIDPMKDPVTDGDTIWVYAEGAMRDAVDIRFTGINTLEATHEWRRPNMRPPVERCERGELLAGEAQKFLKKVLADHDNEVYLRSYEFDQYGRPASEVWVKKKGPLAPGENPYLNVNKLMIEEGLALAYFVAPDESGRVLEYLAAQEKARAAKKGIWADEHFQKESLFITSSHPLEHENRDHPRRIAKAERKEREGRRDFDTPPDKEYFRIIHTGGGEMGAHPINLRGWKIVNGTKEFVIDRDYWLHPGYTARVHTHFRADDSLPSSDNLNAPLYLDLGLNRDATGQVVRPSHVHYWDDEHPILLYTPDGRLVCGDAESQVAFDQLPPPIKRYRGEHY
ncbi:MAG: thermonuclease family protein, partial [Deltaproteobacteria bacterium]|nr:thermonuclease family protein [Deltaproteobacteria bacterium]